MKQSKLYEQFKRLNPWPVRFKDAAQKVLDDLIREEAGKGDQGKSQKLILDLFKGAAEHLKTFPPDDRFFTDPRPSLANVQIWLVVTLPHKKVLVKAEYTLEDHLCWVTEIGVR